MVDLLFSFLPFIVVFGALGGVMSRLRPSRQSRRKKEPELARRGPPSSARQADPMAQMGKVEWSVKKLMNPAEFRTFRQLELLVAQAGGGQRLFSQVSMGEFLSVNPRSADRSARTSAFNRINSKRVDYLIIDQAGFPVAALEYQGSGHYQADAVARDNIKREAFRLAGVPFVEVARQGLSDGQMVDLRLMLGMSVSVAAE